MRRLAGSRDPGVIGIVLVWIAIGTTLDAGAGIWRQRLIGLATWALLLALLRGERRRTRAQVAVVIACATATEYVVSVGLGLYAYRLHNVPSFVPPGHGL